MRVSCEKEAPMRGASLGRLARASGLMPVGKTFLNEGAGLRVLSLLSPSLVKIIVVVDIRRGRFVSVQED
jgi:hypothetical protein